MDIQAMQSVDWLFKKERIYLLAQFWQQRATLAEKEVSALKEQLATSTSPGPSPTPGSGGTAPVPVTNSTSGTTTTGIGTVPSMNLPLLPSRSPVTVTGSTNDMEQGDRERDRLARFEMEMNSKEKEIAQLVEDVRRLQNALAQLQDTSAQQISRLEEQIDQKNMRLQALEARLDSQRDYEEVKRELSILKSIEFPLGVAESKPLEMFLMDRSKSMQVENASLKMANCNLQGEEIVASWRRSLERTMLSQNAAAAAAALANINQNHMVPLSPDVERVTSSPLPKASTPLSNHEKGLTHVCGLTNGSQPPSSPQEDTCAVVSSIVPTSHANGATPKTSGVCDSVTGTSNNIVFTSANSSVSESPVNTSVGLHFNHLSFPPGLCPPIPSSLPPSSAAALVSLSQLDPDKSPFRFDERGPFRFEDRLGEQLIPKGDPMEARLQEMLRYNMDKYQNQNLDTLHISRRVRELLSIHNIGQRLFAKYVLGLSQGTVSELLSKPKPWDKLTEKGRDSYRKMHAWATDENAVLLLKSLIPKKGKESGLPPFGRSEDSATEERIALILNEASQAMKSQPGDDSHSNDSKSPTLGDQDDPFSLFSSHQKTMMSKPGNSFNRYFDFACPSPLTKEQALAVSRRLRKYENDDIPQEKVAKIYQEELAKIMGRRLDDGLRGREQFNSLLFPHFFSGALIDRTQEEIRMALDIYHRELAKLNAGSCGGGMPGLPAALMGFSPQHMPPTQNGMAQDLSLPKERICKEVKLMNGRSSDREEHDKQRPEIDPAAANSIAEALRHAGSAFSLVRPKLEPGIKQEPGIKLEPGAPGSTISTSPLSAILPPTPTSGEDLTPPTASPLQRMASITNSLISQPTVPAMPSPSQRPLRAVLPPITQQQFDQYNNLNTEDIVRKVKEQLSQYSISQRLFGESVLGLSQGSVSDLLARPKPWHMLTQKGREPFIRMKMFLEDENAVHKLVASQYKIAPEKLMRTGAGYAGNPLHYIFPYMQCNNRQTTASTSTSNNKPPPKPPEIIIPKSPMESPLPHVPITTPNAVHVSLSHHHHHPPGTPLSVISSLAAGVMDPNMASPLLKKQPTLRSLQHMQPSVYEMAALTQDLDTQTITTKIKESLLANNIGQKIFGEVVLGLSQGSVSELLSKPKPWHMLSIKGREPFIRMQLWLNDPHNVEKLQTLKNERREANKRRRTGTTDNNSDTSSNDTADFYNLSPSPGGGNGNGAPSAKKQRVLFSEEQKEALRLAFALDPYPNMATIEFLAQELNLAARTITNWFHNHRMRLKQQVGPNQPSSMDNLGLAANGAGREGAFDPVQFRLLLNQRLIELQKEQRPHPLGALAGALPSQLPYPFFSSAAGGALALMKDQMNCGLDLSMSSYKREVDCDNESNASSNDTNEESNLSPGSYHENDMRDVDITENNNKNDDISINNNKVILTGKETSSRSSRRKPAAPQWVNPDWQDSGDEKEKEVIINGVCVMQTTDFDVNKKEETVHVEPMEVMDQDGADSDDNELTSAAVPSEQNENFENHKSDFESEEIEDEPKEPLIVASTADSPAAHSSSTDDDKQESENRRETIAKLTKQLEKEDDENWEF